MNHLPQNLERALRADFDAALETLKYAKRSKHLWPEALNLARRHFGSAREQMLRHRGILAE